MKPFYDIKHILIIFVINILLVIIVAFKFIDFRVKLEQVIIHRIYISNIYKKIKKSIIVPYFLKFPFSYSKSSGFIFCQFKHSFLLVKSLSLLSSLFSITSIYFLITLVCSKTLPNGAYENLLIVAAFSNNSFSDKTSSPVKNSYLPTFADDKAVLLADYLNG